MMIMKGRCSMDILAELKLQRDKLDKAIAALQGKVERKRGRKMSKAARARISKAMKQRWAKRNKKSSKKH